MASFSIVISSYGANERYILGIMYMGLTMSLSSVLYFPDYEKQYKTSLKDDSL